MLAENIDLHIIHLHLHIEFKRLYLQVCKINSVICCNCVPIQYSGHIAQMKYITFKNHIPEDERWQSSKGGCTSVILTGSRGSGAWLGCRTEEATALGSPHLQRKLAWMGAGPTGVCSFPDPGAQGSASLPKWKVCMVPESHGLLLNAHWAGQNSHWVQGIGEQGSGLDSHHPFLFTGSSSLVLGT